MVPDLANEFPEKAVELLMIAQKVAFEEQFSLLFRVAEIHESSTTLKHSPSIGRF